MVKITRRVARPFALLLFAKGWDAMACREKEKK